VGTVCFAWASKEAGCEAQTCHFTGDRAEVREQSVRHALRGLIERVDSPTVFA
jgi:nicotinamide-nucleotide amidase